MKKIDLPELRKIQLGIQDAIHEFCSENGLRYSLACGTLLGAARHKGYIPWDDDIDIYMLREDYNVFISKFPQVFKSTYELISLERNQNWDRPYAKVFDNRTKLEEDCTSIQNIGVNIDIFPIDYVPETQLKWFLFNKVRRFLQYIYKFKIMSFRKGRKFYKNLLLSFSKAILYPLTSRQIAMLIQRYSTLNNKTSSTLVFESVLGMLLRKPFPKRLFNELIELPFEDRSYMAFKNYDAYLSTAYGNWRKLPPENKRISHHAFSAFWTDK